MGGTQKDNEFTPCTWQCAPSIRWFVEIRGLRLVDRHRGTLCSLNGLQAAAWDLISRGRPTETTIRMLSAISTLPREEIERYLFDCLEEWTEAGLLIEKKNHG